MTYEFQCQTCSYLFEVTRSMNDTSEVKCPECGKQALQVITGGAGFLANGSRRSTPCGSACESGSSDTPSCPSGACGDGCCNLA